MEDVVTKFMILLISISQHIYGEDIIYISNDIQNIALNEKNVYIGAKNSIWKFDYDLKKTQEPKITGPRDDNPAYCTAPGLGPCFKTDVAKTDVAKSTDNYNQILLITKGLSKTNSLLSCGTLYLGVCEYLSLDSLENENLNNDLGSSLLINWVSANLPNASTVAVPSSDGDVLYVARTMTYYTDVYSAKTLKLISARTLLKDGVLQNLKALKGDEDTIIPTEASFCDLDKTKDNQFFVSCYHIYYTDAFYFNNAVYFTTIQRSEMLLSGAPYVSKLVRISQEISEENKIKKKLKTYIENTLACNHKNVHYNLLLSVSILDITTVYPDFPDIHKDDQIIFGVFAQSGVFKRYPGSYAKYAICKFSMNSINEVLNTTIERCNRKPVSKVPWIQSVDCRSSHSQGPVSYAPNKTIDGIVLHTEEKRKFQAISSYAHAKGISLFVSSNGHSVLKFALVSDGSTISEYSRKVFAGDSRDKSMFFKMALNPNKATLFLASKNSLAQVPVVECSSRESCVDCLIGPSCGWCSLMRKCTMRNKCPDNEKTMYFVDDNIDSCPIATIKESSIPMEELKEITLVTSNVPEGINYKCKIGSEHINLTRANSTFTCDNFDFSRISNLNESVGEGSVSISIESTVSGKYYSVVTATIIVYKCASYKSCNKCIAGKYPCGWCTSRMTCSDARTNDCNDWISYKGHGTKNSSQVCPMLLSTPNKFLPSGDQSKVILNGRLFPKPSTDKRYTCIMILPGIKTVTTKTTAVRKSSSELSCQQQIYAYPDTINRDSVTGIFRVGYGDAFIDSSESQVKVTLYKCSAKKYCSLCMNATAEWNCGWCGAPQTCRWKNNCGSSDAFTRCPNPAITMFKPEKVSINARSKVVISGTDLGSFNDIHNITVAGERCQHLRDQHIESKEIVCEMEPVDVVKAGIINVSLTLNGDTRIAKSQRKFSFVKPVVRRFEPKNGPCSGGTVLTITGNNLDAGNKIQVFVGSDQCTFGERTSTNITCITSAAKSACQSQHRRRRSITKSMPICITFENDDGSKVCSNDGFRYLLDPTINSVYTNKESIRIATFFSGGQVIHVEGMRLDVIQNPKIIFHYGDSNESKSFQSNCSFVTGDKGEEDMLCLAPNISSLRRGFNESTTVWLGFKMANVINLRKFRYIKIEEDPIFYPFNEREGAHNFKNLELRIRGSGLKVLSSKDVEVEIAGIRCPIVGLFADKLICLMPEKKELDRKQSGDVYPVKVTIGIGGLEYAIGFVRYSPHRAAPKDFTLYFILAAAGVLLIIIIIVVYILYKRRHLRDKKDYVKNLQLHMDKIESQYARECKEAFAEYQIERSDLTSEVEQENAPCREFCSFAMRVLYPGLESHPILDENKDDRKEWEQCMLSFIELLKNKEFILTFVRTLEGQSTFQMTDRCIVASLLMVSLQDDIAFVTDILKELLTDLINKAGSGKRPKLLLRRTESIAEKLLTNWLAYTLYDFLNDVVGEPLFKLFTAVNILLDKEPADAVTFDAKNSLSEDKLLRTKIDFKPVLINVEYIHPKFGSIYEGIPVLSTDTITQCKEKIIKFIYKNQPHSQRPLPEHLQLGHVGTSGAIRYMQDCDASNIIEGEWKKLNTLDHVLTLHKIPECACLRLSMCTEVLSVNGSAMMDDSLPNITFPSSISSTPMLYDYTTLDPKLFHLVKPSDSDFSKDDIRQSKMMAEVYLTRLLKTKETLLSFVNNLFDCIFGLCGTDRVIPPSIKFLFDFLDSQAENMAIDDSDVHHTWKNNSLPLRFWINIIKNPDFVFDIRKSNTVDSCLSVIAQLFMDSCSPDEHRLGKDSPSNKLLYAKEIPGYKKEVKRFYKDVKESRFEEKEFYHRLDEISSIYGNSFNSCNAAYELMSYAIVYKVKLMDNLEDNNYADHAEKLQEIMENIPDD